MRCRCLRMSYKYRPKARTRTTRYYAQVKKLKKMLSRECLHQSLSLTLTSREKRRCRWWCRTSFRRSESYLSMQHKSTNLTSNRHAALSRCSTACLLSSMCSSVRRCLHERPRKPRQLSQIPNPVCLVEIYRCRGRWIALLDHRVQWITDWLAGSSRTYSRQITTVNVRLIVDRKSLNLP